MRLREAARLMGVSILSDTRNTLTTEALNKAFRSKAQLYHPDKGGDADTFRRLVKAREILESYISKGTSGPTSDDIFARVFRSRKKPARKAFTFHVDVDLEDVYHRRTIKRTISTPKACKNCHGTGRVGDECMYCKGTGYRAQTGNMPSFIKAMCKHCMGTGMADECPECEGVGFRSIDTEVEINLSQRVFVDHMIRIQTGDQIVIHVNIPDDFVVTSSNEIIYTKEVKFLDVLRGYNLTILGEDFYIPPRLFTEVFQLGENLYFQPQISKTDPIFDEILEHYESTERAD